MSEAITTFEQWAILELMGHVRLAGKITEEEHFGSKLGRIDVPNDDGGFTTQFFGGNSIYRLTPTTEEIARSVAKSSQPAPVHSWELPRLPSPKEGVIIGEPAFDIEHDDDDELVGDDHPY